MPRRLAIFHPAGRLELKHNPFGKDVANLQLFRALACHGGLERLDVLSAVTVSDEELSQDIYQGGSGPTEVRAGSTLDVKRAAEAGALLRSQPALYDLAWMRRRSSRDRAYSLAGLVHTVAPLAMRQIIAMNTVAPMHPWDAIICTSPSVQENLGRMFDGWGEHLAERTGGRPPPRPALPLVPLGVNAQDFKPAPERRAAARARLGLAEDDPLILWVGRLSYFEKAFPQPMFAAVQGAARATGARAVFVMAGWFPAEADRERFEAAARAHAPDVRTEFVDGNDREMLSGLWAGADIFLSLVDNIQETFGLTPLEAMAAGLPVVASDWDGYRYTMRDGVEALLVPTLLGPAGGGLGASLAAQLTMETISYQTYVGAVAQHTAVHVGRAAQAIAELIRNPDLRRRMGEAGRSRVAQMFDWPVVARAYMAMFDELAEIRAGASDPPARPPSDPVKGDPFVDFQGFASQTLTLDTRLAAVAGVTDADVRAAGERALDSAFGAVRSDPEACARALAVLQAGPCTLRELLLSAPVAERRRLEQGVAWMAKYGFVDWLA